MKVIEVKKAFKLLIELTEDECRALVEVLEPLTDELGRRTYDIFDKLDDIVCDIEKVRK